MMKRKITHWLTRPGIFALVMAVQFGCSTDAENQDLTGENQLTSAELQMIMETDQWTGAADEIITQLYQHAAGISGKFADEGCYEAMYSETGFKVVFGNCLLNQTDKVNGTLVVTYDTDSENAAFKAVYTGFFVGGVELNGTRIYTLSETGEKGFRFSVVSEMTVKLSEEETISEKGFKEVEFRFGDSLSNSYFTITGDWTIQAGDDTYAVFVESPLMGNLSCAYLLSGVMDVSKNGLTMSVDFGDGTCDSEIAVIYPDGYTEQINL